MREAGARELEIAEIELRRIVAKRDEKRGSLFCRVMDLKGEVAPFLFGCVEMVKSNTRAALEEVLGTDGEIWTGTCGGELHHACSVKARPMFSHWRIVDGRGYACVTGREKLRQIRAALEYAATIES